MGNNEDILFTSPLPGVKVITFNRPAKKNAIAPDMYITIADFLDHEATNNDTSVIIFTGRLSDDNTKDKYFTSGADLSTGASFDSETKMNESPAAIFMYSIINFPKLIIVAVNGSCVGIGVTLLAYADLAYGVVGSKYWTPFLGLGIVPEFCSSKYFIEKMGNTLASEMLFMGKKFTSMEMQEAGLLRVVQSCSPEDLLDTILYNYVKPLLEQPLASKSIPIFKKLMRGDRLASDRLKVKEEFEDFDKRIQDGDVMEAFAERLRLKQQRKQEKKQFRKSKL